MKHLIILFACLLSNITRAQDVTEADYYVVDSLNKTTDSICRKECLQLNIILDTTYVYYAVEVYKNTGATDTLRAAMDLHPKFCINTNPGRYTVRLVACLDSTVLSCKQVIDTDRIFVKSIPKPLTVQYDYKISEGEKANLKACARANDNYQWEPAINVVENNDSNIVVQPEETQVYRCIATDSSGCTATCDYNVHVINTLLVPTAFSPNNDGQNDYFRILNDNITLRSFSVYNSWGDMVFSTKDFTDRWDGTYKGAKADIGVYVWEADYVITETNKHKSAKGNVTLVR